MIKLKSDDEIEMMAQAGRIVAGSFKAIEKLVRPGTTTRELDRAVADYIASQGAVAAFLGYCPGGEPFPASICASVNEEVVHGIPGDRALKEGDIISVDVGVKLNGYFADAAWTYAVGRISRQARRLLDVTRRCLYKAIEKAKPGVELVELSRAIQQMAESSGFSVVKKFVGHGIGSEMHEDPQIPNFVSRGFFQEKVILKKGMALAIEPMVNCGTHEVQVLDNKWTVVTRDRKLSAHFEHTVAVRDGDSRILTAA
jgi:methionyl aminopeptidase